MVRHGVHSGLRPDTTSISHGPTNPSGPSNRASARPISSHVAARSGSGSAGEHLVQGAERFPLEPDAVGGGRQPERARYVLDLDVLETGGAQGSLGDAGGAEAERSGLSGGGWGQLRPAPDHPDRQGEEPVAVGSGVHDGGEPPARPQRLEQASEGGCRSGK